MRRRTANYVKEEALRIIDRKFQALTDRYYMEMDYIRNCVPEYMRTYTTGVVMIEARHIACNSDQYDLKRHISERDDLIEQINVLGDLIKEIRKI